MPSPVKLWKNFRSGGTPLSAEELNIMEELLEAYSVKSKEEAEAASDKSGSATTAETKATAAATTKATEAETKAISAAATKSGEAETKAISNATTKATTAETNAVASAKTNSEAEVKFEKEARETAEALKAPLANPAFTGVPKVPTATAKTSTEQAASTAFTQVAKGEAETASIPARKIKALGEVTGTVKINLSEAFEGGVANYFTMKAIGNLVIQLESWPSGVQEPTLEITEDATGGRTIEIVGAVGAPTAPVYNTEPNAINIIPLLSRNSGSNIWISTGPKGEIGATGAKGETTGSIEASVRASWPIFFGRPGPSAYTEVGKAFRFWWSLVVVPVKAKKLKLVWVAGETSKGNVRAVILDTGHAVAGKYTPLAASALVEPAVKEKPAVLAELTRSSGEWEQGEVLMVGIGAENTAMKLPFGVTGATGSELLLPEAQELAGIGTITAPTLSGFTNLTQAEFEAGSFAAIAEGAMSPSNAGITFTCRWE